MWNRMKEVLAWMLGANRKIAEEGEATEARKTAGVRKTGEAADLRKKKRRRKAWKRTAQTVQESVPELTPEQKEKAVQEERERMEREAQEEKERIEKEAREEQARIEEAAKEAERQAQKKIMALFWLDMGYPLERVAKAVGKSQRTVLEWVREQKEEQERKKEQEREEDW